MTDEPTDPATMRLSDVADGEWDAAILAEMAEYQRTGRFGWVVYGSNAPWGPPPRRGLFRRVVARIGAMRPSA